MSSGFVSGGTIDQPTDRDDEWWKAQEEIEAKRRAQIEEGQQEGGKSLYEVLEANKAAKREAFEESFRLKNQFRSLDEDEVEFLDSVLESTRAKEAEVKKETSEQLEIFRRQREEADKALLGQDSARTSTTPAEEEQWYTSGRKRKRPKDAEGIRGLKARKPSSTGGVVEGSLKAPDGITNIKKSTTEKMEPKAALTDSKPEYKNQTGSRPTARPGLVSYGSDDESDDDG